MADIWLLRIIIDDGLGGLISNVGVFDSLDLVEKARQQVIIDRQCELDTYGGYTTMSGDHFEFGIIPLQRNVIMEYQL